MLNDQEARRALAAMTAWTQADYPLTSLQDEIAQVGTILAWQGMDLATAYAKAQSIVRNRERRAVCTANRKSPTAKDHTSLDAVLERDYGDELTCHRIEPGSLDCDDRYYDNHKAKRKATPRQPERGIDELGLEDETTFPTILKNDYQRGILPEVGELGLDIALQPKREADLLRLILSSVTKRELAERGYKPGEIVGATEFLTDYYAPR